MRKVQFPTRLAQSVSDRPPGARLRELDDDFDEPAAPTASTFSASDVPPEDLPISRPEEPKTRFTDGPSAGSLSAALLSRLRRAKGEPSFDEQPFTAPLELPHPPSRAAAARTSTPQQPHRYALRDDAQHAPSRTGGTFARSLWGTARSPLAALLVAGVFYVGGTELIGRTRIALSKPSVPAIPELGTLETSSGESRSNAKSKDGAAPATDGETVTTTPASRERAPLTTELVELPPGLSWPGKGLVEVVTPEDELIYVDGVFIGRGPLRRIPLTPGEHEVWIQKDALRQTGKVQVVLDRSVRAVFAFR